MKERNKKGKGGRKGRSTSDFWADLQHQGIWHLKQWSNEKPCVQVMSLIFLVLQYLEVLQVNSCCGVSERVTRWVMGKVAWYRQGPLQRFAVSSLQTSAANFPLDPGIYLSCCRHSSVLEGVCSHALQHTEIRAGGGVLRKECWMATAGFADYRRIFVSVDREMDR